MVPWPILMNTFPFAYKFDYYLIRGGWVHRTFAPIYLKTSTKEGEIFCAFLVFGTLSTMVPCPNSENVSTFPYIFNNS